MSRLAWGGDDENAFLWAVLGFLRLSEPLTEAPPAAPTPAEPPADDDPLLWALLGLHRLRADVVGQLGPAPVAPPTAAPPPPADLLR